MWLKIEPKEPLILGDVRSGSQFLTTRAYVPGRVLRGAWAEWLLRQGRSDEEILARVETLRIGNFFPAPEWKSVRYALPLPMSAMTCKRERGFRREPSKSPGHGVVDTLLPHLAYWLLQEAKAQISIPFSIVCDKDGCGSRMEPFSAFYAVYRGKNGDRYVQVQPQYHTQTKVALSRLRRASAEGMLYTATGLSPWIESPTKGQSPAALAFYGRVHGDQQAVQELLQALNQVPIGSLHTRGYGQIEVEPAQVYLPPLEERLKEFNQTLNRCWRDLRRLAANAQDLPDRPPGRYFSVDLLAPGVFQCHGAPTLVPRLTLNGQEVEPLWWMTRPDMASGWSVAWGLPKPTNLAARMGSVYVFRWEGEDDALIPALEMLETQGIGERQDEGFGECLVCHPFHMEVEGA